MAAYAEKADLLVRIPEADLIALTDDAGAGVVDDDIVTGALEDGAAEIDMSLCERYSVPITGTIPRIVTKWNVVLALKILFDRREAANTDTWKRSLAAEYEATLKTLEEIKEGKIAIALPKSGSGKTVRYTGPEDKDFGDDFREEYE